MNLSGQSGHFLSGFRWLFICCWKSLWWMILLPQISHVNWGSCPWSRTKCFSTVSKVLRNKKCVINRTHIFGKISEGKSDKVCQEYRYATWRHAFEVSDEMQIIFHKHHSSHDVMYHVFVLEKLSKNSNQKFSTKISISNFKSHSCVDLNFFLLWILFRSPDMEVRFDLSCPELLAFDWLMQFFELLIGRLLQPRLAIGPSLLLVGLKRWTALIGRRDGWKPVLDDVVKWAEFD